MDRTLVYRINFDGLEAQAANIGKVDRELTQLNETIKQQRTALAQLETFNQKGTQAYADLTRELGENIVQSRNLTKAKSDLIRETQNEAKVSKENEGSIVSLRAQLSNLTKEYNNLTKAERETGKGKDVQNQARAISDELKALEGAIGDTRRNVGNYSSALAVLETDIKGLIAAQLALTKSGQQNTAEYEANEEALQSLSKEYSDVNKDALQAKERFANLTGTIETTTESSEGLRTKLKQLREAAATAGEGTEDFKRLTAEAGALQDQIEDANEAIAQEKGTAFERFRAQLGGIGESLGNLDFKQANERIQNLGGTLKGLTFKSAVGGVKGFGTSMLNLGRVLLANPIFLIATIVAAVGAAMFALKDKVAIVGKAFDIITAPIRIIIQAFKDLGDAAGLTTFAIDEASAKNIAALDKLAVESKKSTDAIISNLDREIALRKAAGEDAEQAERRRLIELKNGAQQEIDIQKEKIKELEKALGNGRLISQEQQDEYDKEIAKLDELGEAYKDAINESNVYFSARDKQREDDAKKEAEAQKKINDARLKANEDLRKQIDDANIKLIEDELTRQLEQASLNNERRKKEIASTVADTKLKNEALLAQEKLYQQELTKIIEDAATQEYLALKKRQDLVLELEKAETERILEARKDRAAKIRQGYIDLANDEVAQAETKLLKLKGDTDAELNVLDAKYLADLAAFEGSLKQKELLTAQYEAARQEIIEDARVKEIQQSTANAETLLAFTSTFLSQIGALRQQESNNEIARFNSERDARIKAIEESTLSEEDKAKKIAAINKEQDARVTAEKKKAAEQQKKIALAQIAIDTARGIAGAVAAGAGLVFPANLAAIVSGIAAVVTGIFQAKAALSATPEFAEGGIIQGGHIRGKSHAQGGVVVEAEGGEIIVNKGIQRRPDFVRAISEMNYLTGGKRFETGGIVQPRFTSQGVSLATQAQRGNQNISVTVPPIVVTNNVTDVTNNQATIINIQADTQIGN